MLTNSAVIYYNADTSLIEIRDKYMAAEDYSFAVPNAETIEYWTFDEQRLLLWLHTTVNKIYRIKLTETAGNISSHNVEATIDMSYRLQGDGTKMDVYRRTGDLYFVRKVNNSNRYVSRILVDGSTVDSSITISKPGNFSSEQDQYRIGIKIDQFNGKIMMFDSWLSAPTSVSTTYTFPQCTIIENDLSSYDNKSIALFGQCYTLSLSSTNYISYATTSDYGYFTNDCATAWNPIKNAIVSFTFGFNYFLHFYKSDVGDGLGGTMINKDYSSSYGMNRGMCWVGQKTGNVHNIIATKKIMFDTDTHEITHEVTYPFSSYYVAFHPFTEEHYRYNNSTKIIYMYDKYGTVVGDSLNITFVSAPSHFLVLPGGEDDIPVSITPNVMLFPGPGSRTSDTTPTMVFRCGASAADWTQQFKIVGDTDIQVIVDGQPEDTYLRNADSWSAGSEYADWTWEYSIDYPGYGDPTTSGIWNTTGSGTGVQSGGVEGVDGVICTSEGTRYVKCTVPGSQALTGAESEQIWYFKLFSNSTVSG